MRLCPRAWPYRVLIVLLLVVACWLWWWWPTLGATAKGFPGNRTLSEQVSQFTGGGALPDFDGAPVAAHPLPPLPMPAHPVQDNRGYSGAHGDSYNSGVLPATGPLGNKLELVSRMAGALPSYCSTQHFDHRGRVITMCVGTLGRSRLLLLDPADLAILAVQELPPRAGWYLRMDRQGRVIVPAGDLSIQVFEVDDSGLRPAWRLLQRHDLAAAIPAGQRGELSFPLDLVADWQGNWWFTILEPGMIGYLAADGSLHTYLFEDQSIQNGLAADDRGVYVATTRGLYGMRAGEEGVEVFASLPYETGEHAHALSSGSGTTPVLFGERLIAFADSADPRPNVLVYQLSEAGSDHRLVCKLPIFRDGRTVLENSFIGYDHSLIIENNKGFKLMGDSSDAEPGIARVDVRRDLSGCDLVWENYGVRAGTGAKLSLGSGLIYVHELLQDTGAVNAWYITALDFATGERVWRQYVGSGKQWDNALLTISIGPDGLLTSGMFAGVLGLRDG